MHSIEVFTKMKAVILLLLLVSAYSVALHIKESEKDNSV